MKDKKACRTSIGGQAVIEGVMMQSRTARAMAVRNEDGFVELKSRRLKPSKWIGKVPILRGVVSFVKSLVTGTKIIYESSEVAYGVEDEKPTSWVMVLSAFLGIALAIALFFVLPTLIVSGIEALFKINPDDLRYARVLIEGGIRILIFVLYLLLVSLMRDIKRTFMYHGSEHKTINCFEKGLPLTTANVQSCSKRHNRCGTTFLFFVMVVSIAVFSLATFFFYLGGINESAMNIWQKLLFRIGTRLVLLPLVAGLSFELLQALAKLPDNPVTDFFRAPGLALQYLTTRNPEDDMIAVAVAAFNGVLELDGDKNAEEHNFGEYPMSALRGFLRAKLKPTDADEAEADWIICHVTNLKRAELTPDKTVSKDEYKKIMEIVYKRLDRVPLDYILGSSEFYGLTLKVSDGVLIPRADTEVVAEQAIGLIKDGDEVLDLMTGSGCIAAAIKANTDATVYASDISDKALAVARENLEGVTVLKSDVFDGLDGKKFDLIVSNPPYIRTDVIETLTDEVKKQPLSALDGGADGLDLYRRIADSLSVALKKGGSLVLEIGYDQAEQVDNLFAPSFESAKIVKDLSGNDRAVVLTGYKAL